ncbi:MAG: hypothetical protein QOE61_1567 [Micromonosporaceae bacterium]|jgi:bilirubin oxidase|nr:hypothetical protein [Micromonosporaceae bacterium]
MIGQRQPSALTAAEGAALVLDDGARWVWVADPLAEVAPARADAPIDPEGIPKYVTELDIPRVMPLDATIVNDCVDEYLVGVRQFRQQILPPPLPETTVWGYGSLARPGTFRYPGCTIEAAVDRPVRVTWVNGLVDRSGQFRPPLLPIDQTLAWANPPDGVDGRDSKPVFTSAQGPYRGPVPIVAHLDGGRCTEGSVGRPEAWYLPAAEDIPEGYATVGSRYDECRAKFAARHGLEWRPGTATFQYANDQRATTLWYHDHVLGMSRASVYAGLAGFYLLRGGRSDLPRGVLPGPAPALGDPPGKRYYEIPVIIQDRSFTAAGALCADGVFFPSSRTDGVIGPYVSDGGVPQLWVPGLIGTTMVVNGRTWPVLNVEPRRYRLRLLNGSSGRFLILKIAADPTARPAAPVVPFWQIGNEGGFLPSPVRLSQLLLADGERADVIVDFTAVPAGTALYLVNEGPDGPFVGGEPGVDHPPADPATTGQVMKFVVGSLIGTDTSVPPDLLSLPAPTTPGPPAAVGQVRDRRARSGAGSTADQLGMVDTTSDRVLLRRAAPGAPAYPTHESQPVPGTEVWELHNLTAEAQSVHLDDVQFQVVGRGPVGGPARPPEPWEIGFRQVVVAFPGEVVRVRARTSTARSLLSTRPAAIPVPASPTERPRVALHVDEGGRGAYPPQDPVDSGDPVFVDHTGGRRRLFAGIAVAGSGVVVLIAVAILAGFTSCGRSYSPGQHWPVELHQPANVATPDPSITGPDGRVHRTARVPAWRSGPDQPEATADNAVNDATAENAVNDGTRPERVRSA